MDEVAKDGMLLLARPALGLSFLSSLFGVEWEEVSVQLSAHSISYPHGTVALSTIVAVQHQEVDDCTCLCIKLRIGDTDDTAVHWLRSLDGAKDTELPEWKIAILTKIEAATNGQKILNGQTGTLRRTRRKSIDPAAAVEEGLLQQMQEQVDMWRAKCEEIDVEYKVLEHKHQEQAAQVDELETTVNDQWKHEDQLQLQIDLLKEEKVALQQQNEQLQEQVQFAGEGLEELLLDDDQDVDDLADKVQTYMDSIKSFRKPELCTSPDL